MLEFRMLENIVPFVLIAFAYHHCKQREIFVGVGAIIVSFITLSRLVMGERNIHTNCLENVHKIFYIVITKLSKLVVGTNTGTNSLVSN